MADELDIVTQDTMHASRDSGADSRTASLLPESNEDAVAALDDIFKAETGEAPPSIVDPTDPSTEPKAKEDAEDDDDSAGKDDDDSAGKDDDDSAGKDDDDSAGKDDDDSAGKPKDSLDEIQLPPHTSPKAADSFNAVKQKAREQVEAKDREIAELKSKIAENEGKEVITAEEKKELDDLRRFRAAAQIEKDPTFTKKFDDKISANSETIYGVLKEAGFSDEQVGKIKKYGGPHKLTNWDQVYEHLTESQKRVINARLSSTEDIIRDRDLAVKEARENVDQYLETTGTASKATLEREAKIIEKEANDMASRVDWGVKREVPKDATPEQKAEVEAHNKFVDDSVQKYLGLLKDRSPENHAMLAFGTMQALILREALDKRTEAFNKLSEEHKKLEEKWNKVKKSGATNRRSSAPIQKPKASSDGIFTTSAEDALDSLREEVGAN